MDAIKKLREKVIEANRLYEELREKINIPNDIPYQMEGIKVLSEPFIKGVFTLAVIGNMSAGKSAFINALLEDEDLLPTGHFQTTCTLTEIVWAEEKKLVATFGDGRKQIVIGNDVNEKLKELVAINPIFESLPINHINELILSDKGYDEILSKSKTLEKVSGRKVDPELLRKYVQGDRDYNILPKTKHNIPIKVDIEYPLLDSFRGWRIVDTPGIGALGGIDQTTKDFLINDNIDAAIFVFNGADHIEKADVSKMVKTSYSELTDVAKQRTFFVITHAGDDTCRAHLTKTMSTAIDLFSEGEVAISKDRFFAVDSKLSLLYDIAILKHNLDATIFDNRGVKYDRMDEKEIKKYRKMIVMIADELEKENKEFNTENLNERICQIAGFQVLKSALGSFAQSAKKETYDRLFATIQEDINAFGSKKKEERNLWSSKMAKSPEEFELEIESKTNEITEYKNDLLRKFNSIMTRYSNNLIAQMFPQSYERLKQRLEEADGVVEIINAYENFGEMFKVEENNMLEKFSSECKEMQVSINEQHANVSLPPIDIEDAKSKARQRATKTESTSYKIRSKGLFNSLVYYLDKITGYHIAKYEIKTEFYDVVVPEDEISELKKEFLTRVMASMDIYTKNFFEETIIPTGENIQLQIDKLVNDKIKELDTILVAAKNANEIALKINQIDFDLTEIENTFNEVNLLSKIS